jgi:hypothetical protein
VTGIEVAALLAKMATSACVVVIASLVVERSGPLLGALVATLPISMGPAYLFLGMEHGAAFVSAAALASLPSVAGVGALVATYVVLAQRHGLALSLGAGLVGWLVVAVAGRAWAGTLPAAVMLNLVVYAAGILAVRAYRAGGAAAAPGKRWWDVPLRAAAVMAMIGATVLLGRIAGPEAAGVAALAPVVFASLAVILHPRLGGKPSAAVLANSMAPMVGFVGALSLLHLGAVPLGLPVALTAALVTCVGWNLAMFAWARRQWRGR